MNNENIYFLKEVIHIFTDLVIGNGEFKPIQRGTMISTTSIELTEYLITERNVEYILLLDSIALKIFFLKLDKKILNLIRYNL